MGFGEGEGARGNAAAITGNGKSDGAEVRGVLGANEVDGGSTLAVDPFAVEGVESPDAIESESSGGANASFRDGNGIKGFDGMEANERKGRNKERGRHEKSVSKRVAGWQASRTSGS